MVNERMTKRNKNGEVYFPYCFREDTCSGFADGTRCGNCDFFYRLGKRLNEYEETGLAPKEIEKLKKRRETGMRYMIAYVFRKDEKMEHGRAFADCPEEIDEGQIGKWENELAREKNADGPVVITNITRLGKIGNYECGEFDVLEVRQCECLNMGKEVLDILKMFQRQQEETEHWKKEADYWKREAVGMAAAAGEERIKKEWKDEG